MTEKAKSYSYVAFQGAWRGRARGLWATAALGLITGALIGAVAPFLPMVAGVAAPGLAVVGKMVALFAATGMAAGFGIGAVVGASAGAIASVTKEQEDRDLERMEQQGISPTLLKETEVKKTKDTLKASVKDTFDSYINPYASAVFTGFGLLGGAVMTAAYFAAGGSASFVPGMELALGVATENTAAVTSYIVGTMGMFGAIFGVNFPRLASEMQEYTGLLLSGEALGHPYSQPQKVKEKTLEKTPAPASEPMSLPSEMAALAERSSHYQEKIAAEKIQQALAGNALSAGARI